MKVCTKCKVAQVLSEFCKNSAKKDGLHQQCKSCFRTYENSDKGREKDRRYNATDKARVSKRKYKYTTSGRVKQLALTRKRQLAKIHRTPSWLTKDDFDLIEMFYQRSAYMTEVTGIDWHVDHIIPLQAESISGLHVPSNLRIIPGRENEGKGNKYE